MKKTVRFFATLSLLSTLLLTSCAEKEKPQPADLTTAEITQTIWQHETFGNEDIPLLLEAEADGSWSLYRDEEEIQNGTFGTYEYYESQEAYRMVTEEWSKVLRYSSQALDSFIEMRGDETGVEHFFCVQVTYTSNIQDGKETLSDGESYDIHYIGIKSEKDGRLNLSMDGLDDSTFYNFFPAESFSE